LFCLNRQIARWIFAGKFLENYWMNAGFFRAMPLRQSTA
jgi:hypothetical protein